MLELLLFEFLHDNCVKEKKNENIQLGFRFTIRINHNFGRHELELN